MLVIGCTGGIGSGKSSVATLLGERGAEVLDADALAREAVEPGTPGFDAVVARFGPSVVADDGRLDRQALADRVFYDEEERRALEAIVHPAVHRALGAAIDGARDRSGVLVLELPLLVASKDAFGLDAILVVDVPEDLALDRLVRQRAMREDDARARMAAQPSREERLAHGDYVLVNDGDRDALDAAVGRAWEWIEELVRRKG